MQKATLNQCCEVSLSVCYLQYTVLQYHMILIILQSVFDKTVTSTFSPFSKSLFVKELSSFHFWTLCGSVQLICLLVSCIVVVALVLTRLHTLY